MSWFSNIEIQFNGIFTLTETETDKKWVVWDCVEVFILTETDTVTDANGFQTYLLVSDLVSVSVSVNTPLGRLSKWRVDNVSTCVTCVTSSDR